MKSEKLRVILIIAVIIILAAVLGWIGCIILFAAVFFGSAVGSIIYTVTKPTASMKVSWDESVGSEYIDLSYDNDYGNCYDLYIPSGLDTDKDQSLVLYIHGGGFTGGSKDSGTVWCKYLATKGYITASADYTVFKIPFVRIV